MSGSTVYAGGSFGMINGLPRSNIAAIDNSTGQATSWNPSASGPINALAASGSTVYAGGNFTSIGGQPRNNIAALDASTGTAMGWNPNATCSTGSCVDALAVSGSTVYAGGWFSSIGGQPRNSIAALDAASGNATSWDASTGIAGSNVRAIAVSGSTVYAGGGFSSIGGQPRKGIAALDASSGHATSWNPNATCSNLSLCNVVTALAVSGSTVYAGGEFNSMGGQLRSHIAALDASTGNATSWNPGAYGDHNGQEVAALAVSGSTVYAGGWFTSIGGQYRPQIAALDASTGEATSWNPSTYGWNQQVVALAVGADGTLYAGGSFSGFGLAPLAGFAAFKSISLSPSLSVSAPASGAAGTQLDASSIQAGLSGGSTPSGTITFKVFGPQSSPPSDCSGGTTVGTATASGDGAYHPNASFTPRAAGEYWWYASYGGDTSNNPAASACGASMAETVVAATPPSQHTLTVTKTGTGSGTVSSSPAGIACGATCSASFTAGQQVTLTATPAAGSTFADWSGAGCSGTGACAVTMSSDQSVAATFTVSAPPPPAVPVLSRLAVSPRTFALAGRLVNRRCVPATSANRKQRRCTRPVSLRIGYRLSIPARVKITIAQQLPGRLVTGRCVKQTRANAKHRSCTRLVALPGALTATAGQGANSFTFNGRIGGHQLTPGSYRLTATPSANGQTDKPATIVFTITS